MRKTAAHKDSNGEPFTVSVLYAQDEQIVSPSRPPPALMRIIFPQTSLPDPFDSINIEDRNLFASQYRRQIA